MALKDCLYTLEDHPELLAAFKADLQDGTTKFPSYIKTVMKNLSAERRDIQLEALRIKRGIGFIEDFKTRATGSKNTIKRWGDDEAYLRGINAMIATHYDVGVRKSGTLSIEGEAMAFRAHFQSRIATMMEAYKPRKLGFENSLAAQDQLIHGLYGSTTDVDAKSYAKMVTETLEEVRTIRNSFGGNIEKLDNYRLPQTSDAVKVANMEEATWKALVLDTVDLDELDKQVQLLLHMEPDSKPVAGAIDIALSQMYRTISTDGAASIVPRGTTSGLRFNVSKRHADHRFLHFKDAESWLEYNKKAGSETPYTAITNHIDHMSREIAAMKVLGPNPEKALTYLMSYVDKRLLKRGSSAQAHTLYKTVMGELDGAPHPKTAAVLSGARDILAGVKLGSATLSAMSDNYFLGRMATLTDIPVYKMYSRLFSQLSPAHKQDRLFAGQIGMSMDYAIDKISAINRMGISNNNNWTARFADASLRVNGLNYWTQAVEYTFKLEFAQQLGNSVSKKFNELGNLKEIMGAYGITAKDWGVLRTTPLASYKGSQYFDVTAVKDLDLMTKIQGMILSETVMAAPRPTARVQAAMHGGYSAQSTVGMARRAFFQFKGFPVSILMNQWAREFSHNTTASKMLGVGSLVVGTSVMGMMSYNLKEVAKGRTPMEWDDPKLAFNGFMQGGALGLLGDAAFIDPDRPGGLIEFAAGPMLGEFSSFVNDFVSKPMKDVIEMNGKANERLALAAIRFGKRNVPGPLNLTGIKTAFTRATLDQLDKQINPNWSSRNRSMRRQLKRDRGQEYWWKPGELTPDF